MKIVFAITLLLCLWQQAYAYCPSNYYNCGDGYCVPDDDVCDGTEDCHNGHDEDGCTFINVGLAVGLSIAGFVIFIVLPIIICVVICCCLGMCAGAASSGGRTRVITHTTPASTGPSTTVVSSNTSNMMQAPGAYPPSYPADPRAYQPVPGYKV